MPLSPLLAVLIAAAVLRGALAAPPTDPPLPPPLPVSLPRLPHSPSASTDPVHSAAVWPLRPAAGDRPEVVRAFSPPRTTWGPGHRGVDLLGTPGQPVRAAIAGRVVFAGTIAGRGVVVLAHAAGRTTYEPVTVSVAVGQQLAAGAAIGTLQGGASHCPPRACLHWGLIVAGRYRDPLSLFGLDPVRLLPPA